MLLDDQFLAFTYICQARLSEDEIYPLFLIVNFDVVDVVAHAKC